MVNFCMVLGCSSRTRKGQAVSSHRLPIRDLERCKQWLQAINHPNFGEDTAMEGIKLKKVCSFHFKPEDFKLNVLGTKRAALLNTAIPSVFTVPYDDEQPGMSTTSSAKRMCLEVRLTQLYDWWHTLIRLLLELLLLGSSVGCYPTKPELNYYG